MARSTQPRLSRRKSPAFARLSMGVRVRIAGLLVILSVLLSFGVRLSHMLLVQHVVCEHGHLVDERKAATQDEKVRSAKPGLQAGLQAGDHDAEAGDDHDHCDALSVLHWGEGFSSTPSVTTLSWIEAIGLQEARQSAPIAIISLAPKGSPPAV